MFSDAIDKVDLDAPGKMNSTHPGYKILMFNIARIPQEKRDYKTERGETGFKVLMRPGKKNITWMKNVLQKFTKPGNLVTDAYAEVFSVS